MAIKRSERSRWQPKSRRAVLPRRLRQPGFGPGGAGPRRGGGSPFRDAMQPRARLPRGKGAQARWAERTLQAVALPGSRRRVDGAPLARTFPRRGGLDALAALGLVGPASEALSPHPSPSGPKGEGGISGPGASRGPGEGSASRAASFAPGRLGRGEEASERSPTTGRAGGRKAPTIRLKHLKFKSHWELFPMVKEVQTTQALKEAPAPGPLEASFPLDALASTWTEAETAQWRAQRHVARAQRGLGPAGASRASASVALEDALYGVLGTPGREDAREAILRVQATLAVREEARRRAAAGLPSGLDASGRPTQALVDEVLGASSPLALRAPFGPVSPLSLVGPEEGEGEGREGPEGPEGRGGSDGPEGAASASTSTGASSARGALPADGKLASDAMVAEVIAMLTASGLLPEGSTEGTGPTAEDLGLALTGMPTVPRDAQEAAAQGWITEAHLADPELLHLWAEAQAGSSSPSRAYGLHTVLHDARRALMARAVPGWGAVGRLQRRRETRALQGHRSAAVPASGAPGPGGASNAESRPPEGASAARLARHARKERLRTWHRDALAAQSRQAALEAGNAPGSGPAEPSPLGDAPLPPEGGSAAPLAPSSEGPEEDGPAEGEKGRKAPTGEGDRLFMTVEGAARVGQTLTKARATDVGLWDRMYRTLRWSHWMAPRWTPIVAPMVGMTLWVHNGRTWVSVVPTEASVGRRVGEYVPTRWLPWPYLPAADPGKGPKGQGKDGKAKKPVGGKVKGKTSSPKPARRPVPAIANPGAFWVSH